MSSKIRSDFGYLAFTTLFKRSKNMGLHIKFKSTRIYFGVNFWFPCLWEWEWDWLLNVTCNDISVIYVKAHRCAGGLKKKIDQRWGFKCHRLFIELSKNRYWANLLKVLPRNRPILVAFFYTHGDREERRTHSRLNPPGPHGSFNKRFKIVENCGVKAFGDFHFYLRPVLHIFFFLVSYIYFCEMYNSKRCVFFL